MAHYLTLTIAALVSLSQGQQNELEVGVAMKCYVCPISTYCGGEDVVLDSVPQIEWKECNAHNRDTEQSNHPKVTLSNTENYACMWHPRNGCVLAIREEETVENPGSQYCHECGDFCPCANGIPMHIELNMLGLWAVLLISIIICNSSC